jgi:invasion protein IalB
MVLDKGCQVMSSTHRFEHIGFALPHKLTDGRKRRGWAIFGVTLYSLLSLIVWPSRSSAQEVQPSSKGVALQKRIGTWSLYCIEGAFPAGPQDCSLVSSVSGEQPAVEWLKLGLSLAPSSTAERPLISLSIRIPRVDYFKSGISIGADGRQVAQVFIDSCNKSSCEATISVDAKLRQRLLTARSATFDYQLNKTEGVSLMVSTEELPLALVELEKKVGLSPTPIAQKQFPNQFIMTFEVELRTNPYLTNEDGWGKLEHGCSGVSPRWTVSVTTDLKIKNDHEFSKWVASALHCPDRPVLWIMEGKDQHQSSSQIDKEAGIYVVYDALREKKVPQVVVRGVGGIPTRFEQ